MRSRTLNVVPCVPLLLSAIACSSGATVSESNLEVGHYREPCTGVVAQYCLRVTDGPDRPTTRFYDRIAGFEPAWGTSYRIRVEIRDIDDPPADGSSVAYRLLDVESQQVEPQSTEFSLSFSSEQSVLLVASPTGLELRGGPALTCPTGAACQAARDWVAAPTGTLQLTLHHPPETGAQLALTAASVTN